MNKPVRLTPQKKQEMISRHQLRERLAKFEWLATSPEDLGEDFIVQIYFEGRATGVLFHIQEKSVTDLNKHSKGGYLVYPFPTKDLKHWEAFSSPVILVVWDIKHRNGRWASKETVLKQLDRERPGWRNSKKTVSVRLPWKNTFSDSGLIHLRHHIGKYLFPVISQGKELKMSLSLNFTDTQEGQKAREDFERFVKFGEEAKFKSEVIRSVDISEWAKPWLVLEQAAKQEIIIGSAPGRVLTVDVNAIGNDGQTAWAHNIDLKCTRSGTELLRFSNIDQGSPLHFEFAFSTSIRCWASVEVRNWGTNVEVTRETIKFLQILASGGKLQLWPLSSESPRPLEIPVPPQPSMRRDPRFVQVIENLCTIQAKTGHFFRMSGTSIPFQQALLSSQVMSVINEGKIVKRYKELKGRFPIKDIERLLQDVDQERPISFSIDCKESSAELFGESIEMGPVEIRITGEVQNTTAELREAIKLMDQTGELALHLTEVEVAEIYPRWPASENRPGQHCDPAQRP